MALLGVLLCIIVSAFHLHAESDLSGYVQAHGLPRQAQVMRHAWRAILPGAHLTASS